MEVDEQTKQFWVNAYLISFYSDSPFHYCNSQIKVFTNTVQFFHACVYVYIRVWGIHILFFEDICI